MYILQVRYCGKWKWGRNTYPTVEAAEARRAQLSRVGIRSRVRLASELYD